MTLKPHKLNEKKIDSQFSQLIKNFQSHLRNVGFKLMASDRVGGDGAGFLAYDWIYKL